MTKDKSELSQEELSEFNEAGCGEGYEWWLRHRGLLTSKSAAEGERNYPPDGEWYRHVAEYHLWMGLSDIDLLEQAAKAINGVYHWEVGTFFCEQDGNPVEIDGWNPLEDDSDAFRLMLALGLRFEYFSLDPFEVSGQPVCVITRVPGGERNRLCQTLTETGDEAHAVVRRAIVRAAAKIGRQMP
jgi:hypothetical protein